MRSIQSGTTYSIDRNPAPAPAGWWRLLWLAALLSGCVPTSGGSGGDGDAGAPDMTSCQPACGARVCGADGCGGECGTCLGGTICDLAGQCAAAPADCGDGVCGGDEDCATCPGDCGACCGNGVCDAVAGETCETCVTDCACTDPLICTDGRCVEPPPEPPVILTFSSNVRALTVGERIVFSAVVTDPNGIDDLIGGVLEAPDGATYGAFAASGQEGAYGLTLTWDDINQAQAIDFAEPITRPFIARFFDQGGLEVTDTLEITLACDGVGACAGVCMDLDVDPANCGGCGVQCDPAATCVDGACRCDAGLFQCGDDACVGAEAVCDRDRDCADGSDEDGCCFDDETCGLGRVCDDNRCGDGCRAHEGCPAGEQCTDGLCVPGCASDRECPVEDYCDPAGRCREGCRSDDACGIERQCVDGVCVDGCDDDDGCAPGRICRGARCADGCRDDDGPRGCPDGQICTAEACVDGCRQDAACPAGRICIDDACVDGCRGDDGCEVGRICDGLTCRFGCRGDDQCGRSYICEDTRCRWGCRDDNVCDDDQICVDEQCVEGCRVDGACRPGRICEDDRCVLGCRQDAGCRAGRICNNDVCVLGCREDAACDAEHICEDEQCVVGCRDDAGCIGDRTCRSGVCRDLCPGDAGCGDGESCTVDVCLPAVCGNGRLDHGEDCEPDLSPGCACGRDCAVEGLFERDRAVEFEGPGSVRLLARFDQDLGARYAVGLASVSSTVPGRVRVRVSGWCSGAPLGATIRLGDIEAVDRMQPSVAPSLPGAQRLDLDIGLDADARPETAVIDIDFIVPALGDDCGPDGTDGLCPADGFCDPAEQRCTAFVCGDGEVNGLEECDDGNAEVGDGCEDCTRAPIPLGGPCPPDDPAFACVEGYCDPDTARCVAHACGDGVRGPEELCDDGNEVEGDGCHACRYDPFNGPSDARGSRYTIDFADGDTEIVVFINEDERESDGFIIVLDDYYDLIIEAEWLNAPLDHVDPGCPPNTYFTMQWLSTSLRDGYAFLAGRQGCEPWVNTATVFRPSVALRPGRYWLNTDTGTDPHLDGVPTILRVTRTPRAEACGNGLDDDDDGRIDLADPGCRWARDRDEADPAFVPGCADGIDGDEDGRTDWPDDDGCAGAGDASEVEHCAQFDEVVTMGDEGGRIIVNTMNRRQLINPTCTDDTTRQQLVVLSLTRPSVVDITSYSFWVGNTLTLRRACGGQPANEIACHENSRATLPTQRLDAGDYYLYVGMSGNEQAMLPITVDVLIAQQCEVDADCDQGTCEEGACVE